jgi:hypothetical protein
VCTPPPLIGRGLVPGIHVDMLDYEGLLAASDVFSVLPQMFEQWLDSRARPGETRNSRESRRDRARVESLDHRWLNHGHI